jgi:uncharacterized protein YejL (UPF0352 family)
MEELAQMLLQEMLAVLEMFHQVVTDNQLAVLAELAEHQVAQAAE